MKIIKKLILENDKNINAQINKIWLLAAFNNEMFEKNNHYTFIAKYIWKEFILKKPNLENLNLTYIAKKTYSSIPTICRMAKFLQLDGFSELKFIIKEYWKNKEINNE